MILTVHRWFAKKSYPGNWMYARMGDLAEKVTKALGDTDKPVEPEKPEDKTTDRQYRISESLLRSQLFEKMVCVLCIRLILWRLSEKRQNRL